MERSHIHVRDVSYTYSHSSTFENLPFQGIGPFSLHRNTVPVSDNMPMCFHQQSVAAKTLILTRYLAVI